MCGVSVMASPETNVTSVVVRQREFVYVYEYACVVGSRFFSLSLSRDLCHFSDREMSTSSGLSAFSNARRYRFMGEERERDTSYVRLHPPDRIVNSQTIQLAIYGTFLANILA